jgi:hypothetical protein
MRRRRRTARRWGGGNRWAVHRSARQTTVRADGEVKKAASMTTTATIAGGGWGVGWGLRADEGEAANVHSLRGASTNTTTAAAAAR